MKRCYIISAGTVESPGRLPIPPMDGGDIVICADGGVKNAVKLGLKPDIITGDFDSISLEDAGKYGEPLVSSREKDETDTYLAMKQGRDLGYREFIFLGATGGRLDHTLANISLLSWLHENGAYGKIIDERSIIFLMYPPGGTLNREAGYKLSLFPLYESVENIVLKGLKYQIKPKRLVHSFPLGISNEFTGDEAKISFDSGVLIVIYAKDL